MRERDWRVQEERETKKKKKKKKQKTEETGRDSISSDRATQSKSSIRISKKKKKF